MKKVILRDRLKIAPFNEPARDLRVLNKPLWLHQKDILGPYCDSEIEIDFLEQVPKPEDEEMLVYRDNLFFDRAFVEIFLAQARSCGTACRVAFSLDDQVITAYALPLQSGIRAEGDLYVGDMWYYPRGLGENARPLVIDTGVYELGSYHVPGWRSSSRSSGGRCWSDGRSCPVRSWSELAAIRRSIPRPLSKGQPSSATMSTSAPVW
jgi:hypothetical protein